MPPDWEPELANSSAPDSSLDLEFVHGYRAHDCRDNLHFAFDGCIVYHAAALGIVYDANAHKQRFFFGHDADILCLAMHPSGRLALVR